MKTKGRWKSIIILLVQVVNGCKENFAAIRSSKISTTTTSATSTPTSTTTTAISEVVMVTGGSSSNEVGQLAELLFPNGTHICELEWLPEKRFKHSQSGLILCGGWTSEDSCLIFADGSWKEHGTTLLDSRWGHSSWTQGDKVRLIGGVSSIKTTETISFNGVHQASFELEHDTKYACVISLNNSFVVTGGRYTEKIVTLYNDAGYVHELPVLNDGRSGHGCGFYVNYEQKIVLIVAGGSSGGSYLTSTEMLLYDDAKAWTLGKPLSSPRYQPRGVFVGNRFLLTGGQHPSGSIVKDVLMLTEDGKNWKEAGEMKFARYNHGASPVPEETVKYCK